jgi:hypothetical protein
MPRRKNMSIISLPFRITEDWPTPIIKDYDHFLVKVQEPSAYLTKTKFWLNRATLYSLNQDVLTLQTNATPKTDQIYYPLLNFFYHISLSANLLQVVRVKAKFRLKATNLLSEYQQLSHAEKFFALFEAFWVNCDWVDMSKNVGYASDIPQNNHFFEVLWSIPANKEISIKEFSKRTGYYYGLGIGIIIQILSFCGLLTYQLKKLSKEEQYTKGYFKIKSLTISDIGHKFFGILNEKRPFELWNMSYRWELGGAEFPGQDFEDESVKPESFYIPFTQIISKENVLNKGLPVLKPHNTSGTYIFKVCLGEVWRTIAIFGKDSLEELHMAIQDAFDFDNDHLYAFSLDPLRLNPRKSFNDSRGEESPYADEAMIGKLNLYEGQHLLYIFDFGDWWEFDVEVMTIKSEPHFGGYKILERHGKSPEQYPEYDDEDW